MSVKVGAGAERLVSSREPGEGAVARSLDIPAFPDTGCNRGRAAFVFFGRHKDEVQRHVEPEDRVHLGGRVRDSHLMSVPQALKAVG